MTENKRYVAIPETVSYKDTATDEILCLKSEKDYYEVLSLLNHFHDAWFDVHEGLEQIRKEYDELHEEKEQLKERNNRQAKRLAELYELMAKKDWESLTEIIDDFCSCEEQLQREWRTYE